MQSGKRTIRAYEDGDESAVVEVWFQAGKAAYPYIAGWKSMTLPVAGEIFRKAILGKCELWVGLSDEKVVAYLALIDSTIDRLYVDPSFQRQGWGKLLLEHAKKLRPDGLELFTHQENRSACSFYEKEGFRAVAHGLSPPPESLPDVKYRWEGSE